MKDVEIIKARNVLSSRARTNLAKRLRVAAYCRVSTDSTVYLPALYRGGWWFRNCTGA